MNVTLIPNQSLPEVTTNDPQNFFQSMFEKEQSSVNSGYFITINPEIFVQQACLIMEYLFKLVPLEEFLSQSQLLDTRQHTSNLLDFKNKVVFLLFFLFLLFLTL